MNKYHYSTFTESTGSSRWGMRHVAQMLVMPDEEVKHSRNFDTRSQAQAQVREWKAKYGNPTI
jgi:hypothetical protein